MKKIFLLGLLGFGLFGSCSNEELTDGSLPTKGNYTIEATIGDVQTRTSVDANFKVQWNKEDQIGIYGKTATNVLFTLTGDGGTATGQFTGTFNDTPTYAYYPYSTGASITDKALAMTLLDSYSYTGDSNGPMIGKYSNGEITFKHLCGLLKVSINNIPSTATKFVLEGSSAIAGKATVADITAANAVLTLSQTESETSKKVTVSLSEAAITNKEFYFPLPTGTYETLKVSLQNASSEVLYEKTSSNVVITRAGAVDMPMLDASIACLQEIAKSGGTYTLVSDMTGDITISATNPVIINLNGHTITNKSGDTFTVNNGSTLTINGEGKVDNVTHAKACIYNNSTVILNGGTYTRSQEADNSTSSSGGNSYYNILNHGVMTIESGVTISSTGAFSSLIGNGYYSYTSTDERKGYVKDKGQPSPSLTINGGSFSGGINTIKNDDGANLIISDGTFTNNTQTTVQNNNVAEIKGGSFTPANPASHAVESKAYATEYNKGQTTISGGTFTGELYLYNETDATNASFSITGGTFSDPSALAYLAQKANVKVKLLNSYEGPGLGIFNSGSQNGKEATIEVDLNTHTWTLTDDPLFGSAGTVSQYFHLEEGATVTFKNGTIQPKSNTSGKMLIQNYCNLTLDGVTLIGGSACNYVISNNNGSCTINSSTITASSGKCAFDVYSFSTYKGVTVTVNTGSIINGKVEFGGDNNQKNGKLIINGGTFNDDLSVTESYYDSANPNIIINGGNFGSHTGWSTYQPKK